jgi:hypothetical protein
MGVGSGGGARWRCRELCAPVDRLLSPGRSDLQSAVESRHGPEENCAHRADDQYGHHTERAARVNIRLRILKSMTRRTSTDIVAATQSRDQGQGQAVACDADRSDSGSGSEQPGNQGRRVLRLVDSHQPPASRIASSSPTAFPADRRPLYGRPTHQSETDEVVGAPQHNTAAQVSRTPGCYAAIAF